MPQIYVMLFLTAILVLTFLLYPAAPRHSKGSLRNYLRPG